MIVIFDEMSELTNEQWNYLADCLEKSWNRRALQCATELLLLRTVRAEKIAAVLGNLEMSFVARLCVAADIAEEFETQMQVLKKEIEELTILQMKKPCF